MTTIENIIEAGTKAMNGDGQFLLSADEWATLDRVADIASKMLGDKPAMETVLIALLFGVEYFPMPDRDWRAAMVVYQMLARCPQIASRRGLVSFKVIEKPARAA